MEDSILLNEQRVNQLEEDLGAALNEIEDLKSRLAAAEKAIAVLTNTLHVVDAASLLAVYSLIKTDSLRQPDFKSKQDVIDSGCSDAITRMLKTVQVYMNNEKKSNGKDETEGR